MATKVGEIYLVAKIDTSQYKRGAKEIERANSEMEGPTEKSTSGASAAFSRLATAAKVATVAVGVALAGGLIKAATASWQQVGAVEQATVGLRAYERDAGKVNSVLNELVAYARSDMGVLFNRKDLFQSAQMLKLNGVETKDLSNNVKILSRSVGLGLGNWQDLNSVVGRVVATGRLSGIEFDQLTQYGFKLDKSLRNTNLSATDLFKALDKGIPVDAMKGQANTIQGLGIRMQTAFRSVGDAILGVDADTGKFTKGSLGMALTNAMVKATELLKGLSKSFRDVIPDIQAVIKQVGDYLGPKFDVLWNTITTKLIPAVQKFAKTFGPVAGAGLVGVIGFATDALNILLQVATPVLNYLSDNTWIVWGLVTAFLAWKAALAISATVQAFQSGMVAINAAMVGTSGVAAATTGRVTALRVALGLVAVPWQITLGIVGVAAVVYGIHRIARELDSLIEKFKKTNQQRVRINGQEVAGSGGSGLSMVQQIQRAFQGRATGGPVTAGTPYIVGEKRPELFVPDTNGTIIPNLNSLGNDRTTVKPEGNTTYNVSFVMEGVMARSRSDVREIFKDGIRAVNEEIKAKGGQPIGGVAI